MLSRSVNSAVKSDKRTKKGKAVSSEVKSLPMSLAHLNDSIGYENPHVLTHAKAIKKYANDPAQVKREVDHVLGHAKHIAQHNRKLTKKLMMIPSVKTQLQDLKKAK